jgi:NADP-dependent 3-hydroxy acid dehydrogenase YdfG
MKVVMVAQNIDRLQQAAQTVQRSVCKTCDVAKRSAVQACVDEVLSECHQIDLLVNCAGVMYFTLMKNMHVDEWESMIDINCKGVVNFSGTKRVHCCKGCTVVKGALL